MRHAAVLALFVLAAGPAWAQSPLPDPKLTPGALNPDVTQATIGTTICLRGWTRSVRPPRSYTERLKREQIAKYRYQDTDLRDYQEDHLIPLELGGATTDPRNLWPEPHDGVWNSRVKDRLERRLHSLVCNGALSLAEAQQAIATSWIEAYQTYIGDLDE
jgi:hypothetical protein